MKFKHLIFLIFLYNSTFSQEKLNTFEIYKKDKIHYKKSDNNVFTGIAEFKRKNGHIVFEEFYKDGYLTKYVIYFNLDIQIVSTEILYYDKSENKKTKTEFSSVENERKEITHYDSNGKKTLNEIYKKNILIYSCEYLNNKKHGKEFCITDNGDLNTEYFENGKRLK